MRKLQIIGLASIFSAGTLAAADIKKSSSAAEQQAIQFERAKFVKAQQEMRKAPAPARVAAQQQPQRKSAGAAGEREAVNFERAKLAASQAEIERQGLLARAR